MPFVPAELRAATSFQTIRTNREDINVSTQMCTSARRNNKETYSLCQSGTRSVKIFRRIRVINNYIHTSRGWGGRERARVLAPLANNRVMNAYVTVLAILPRHDFQWHETEPR